MFWMQAKFVYWTLTCRYETYQIIIKNDKGTMIDCVQIKICNLPFTKEEILHVRELMNQELKYFIWSFHPGEQESLNFPDTWLFEFQNIPALLLAH